MDANELKSFTLTVKSPEGVLYARSGLRSLQLELRDGKLGIHAGHAPMIAEVSEGNAVLDDGKFIDRVPLHAGVVVVQSDVVTIYTHSIDPDLSAKNSPTKNTEEEFELIYESIVSTLMPGSTTAEDHTDGS